MFTPGIGEIAANLGTSSDVVVGATTGFVVFLGLGPLVLAPLSETFGRRKLYLVCFTVFALLQIPTALSPNVESLIAVRAISGFFGSTLPLPDIVCSRHHVFLLDLILTLESRRWYCEWGRDHQRHVPPK